jgi:hypothetical protein
MADRLIRVLFVRSDPPSSPGEGTAPVTPERLARALNTLALCLAKEALLSPEERAQRAEEIAAFVRRQLAVIDQAARQWPACTPAFPSLEEAINGIVPPERTCSTCTCWRRHYEAWKHTVAPAWWPNAEPVAREELEAWVARQQGAVRRRTRVEPASG